MTGLLRRITGLARIARLLRRIAARLTGLRERLGLSLDLATESVNSLRREALETSLLDGGVDLACIESTAAISIGREESIAQLLEHLVQSNVLVEVDALGVVTEYARVLTNAVESAKLKRSENLPIIDLNELGGGLSTQRLATELNLSQFNSANLTGAIPDGKLAVIY